MTEPMTFGYVHVYPGTPESIVKGIGGGLTMSPCFRDQLMLAAVPSAVFCARISPS